LSGNSATDGGAIDCDTTATVTGCTIRGNTATGPYSDGGGLNNSGTADLLHCAISSNSALSGAGLSMGETGS
jgi:predicted outer membrane repeat protein